MKFCASKILAFSLTLLFFSCKKCRECVCEQNGIKTTQEMCVSGTNQNQKLNEWEAELANEQQFENCICSNK
jgi:hypothetical protein